MKKILLLFTLLLCLNASQIKAQSYYKFLNNSSWLEAVNSGFGLPIDYFYYNQTIDTIINTKTYAKIICTSNNSAFFIREDTLAKKVYIKNNATASEVILYDFSLNVGDTLYAQHGWGAGSKLIVRTIDTVTIVAGQRQRFYLSDTSGTVYYTTIESVGCIYDPFLNNSYPPGDPQYDLVCSYQNNVLFYYAGLYGYNCSSYCSQPCNANFTYTIEPNGQVTFTNLYPGYSSTWYGYNGFSLDTTVYSPSVTVTFPCNGTYTVVCKVSVCPTSTANFCYASLPSPGLLYITNIPGSITASFTYTVGAGGQIDFTNTSTDTIGATNYWYILDSSHAEVAQSNLNSPSFTLATNHHYIVTLQLNGGGLGCNSSYTDTIYIPGITTGVPVFENNNKQIAIYPNPANNFIFIQSKEALEVKLFDLLGNEILTTKEKEIDVSNLSEGIYFIHINNFTQKVIVQH